MLNILATIILYILKIVYDKTNRYLYNKSLK